MNGFVSPHSTCSLINSQGKLLAAHSGIAPETAFTGGEWIQRPKQPLVTHKQSRKTDSLPTQKQPSKGFSHVTNVFVSPYSHF